MLSAPHGFMEMELEAHSLPSAPAYQEGQSRDRVCMSCQTFKPSQAFNRVSPGNPTLHPWCKVCRYAPIAKKAKGTGKVVPSKATPAPPSTESPEQAPASVTTVNTDIAELGVPRQKRSPKARTKACVQCKVQKDVADFFQEPGNSSRLQAVCSDCCLAASRRRKVNLRKPHTSAPYCRRSVRDMPTSDDGEMDVEDDVAAAAAALGGLAAGLHARLPNGSAVVGTGVSARLSEAAKAAKVELSTSDAEHGASDKAHGPAHHHNGDTSDDAPRRSKRQVRPIKFEDHESEWDGEEDAARGGQSRSSRGRKRLRVEEPTVAEKTCTKCKQLKGAAEFTRLSTHSTGLHSWCRDCTNEASKKRQEQIRRPGASRAHGAPSRSHVLSHRSDHGSRSRLPHNPYPPTNPSAAPALFTAPHASANVLSNSNAPNTLKAPGPGLATAAGADPASRQQLQLRACTHCRVPKPPTEFYKCVGTSSGLHPWCKQCTKEVQRRNKRSRPAAATSAE